MNLFLEKLYFRIQTLYFTLQRRQLKARLKLSGKEYRMDLLRTMVPIMAAVEKSDLLIDIGANRGEFASIFYEIFRPKKVICIEPNAGLNDSIMENLQGATVNIVNVAVGDVKKTVDFYFHPDSQMSSLFECDEKLLARDFGEDDPGGITRKEVELTTLDSLLHEELDDQYESVFLKIDTQGNELEVLTGGVAAMAKMRYCLVEYMFQTPYKMKYDFEDILVRMSDFGFKCVGPMHTSIRTTGEIGAVLFLFERRNSDRYNLRMQ